MTIYLTLLGTVWAVLTVLLWSFLSAAAFFVQYQWGIDVSLDLFGISIVVALLAVMAFTWGNNSWK